MTFPSAHAAGSPHHFLAQLVGGWTGTTSTWLDPDGDPTDSATQGSIQLILDGRFIIYLYQSIVDGESHHGMFTFGYDTALDQYEASWVDSFHNNTAIMYCTGNPTPKGFFVLGSYPDPEGGPDWGWRTEVELMDADHLSITARNISPEGGESLAARTLLTRLKR
ncbi:MAG TPA: DUF1579 domain-containing protein [Anaerolineales bacterium]